MSDDLALPSPPLPLPARLGEAALRGERLPGEDGLLLVLTNVGDAQAADRIAQALVEEVAPRPPDRVRRRRVRLENGCVPPP